MKLPLTVAERVIVLLYRFVDLEDPYAYPFEMTQEGIAKYLDVARGYVQQQLKELMDHGSVAYMLHRVQGGRKLMKVYFLTSWGVTEATRLIEAVKAGHVADALADGGQQVLPAIDAPAPAAAPTAWRQTGVECGRRISSER